MTTTPVMKTVKEYQERFVDFVERVDETVVDYSGRAVEGMADYVPARPEWLPMDRVPTAREVVENQIWFVNAMVETQSAFARNLLKAAEPVAKKWARKPARRTTKSVPKAA